MFAQRLAVARPLAGARILPTISAMPARTFRISFGRKPILAPLDPAYYPKADEKVDPGQNGGYVNPAYERRQFRDPYAKWWDQQERRNFGEPVHEDNDMLGRFSPEEYTWINPAKGAAQIGMFIATVFGLCGVIYTWYPDKPAVPRTFPHNGLEVALGGKNAVPVCFQH
ncbi:hypothetical protein EDC01DRAFT_231929 [Geopyxis carbonaria]|nr:hypothetical protein EDC01DRAFT_231929 [Geopyxis carbonaria]